MTVATAADSKSQWQPPLVGKESDLNTNLWYFLTLTKLDGDSVQLVARNLLWYGKIIHLISSWTMGGLLKLKDASQLLTELSSLRLGHVIQMPYLCSTSELITNLEKTVTKDIQIGQPSTSLTTQSTPSPVGGLGKKYDSGRSPITQGLAQYFPNALTAVANVSQYGLVKYDLVYSDVNWLRVDDGYNRYSDALGRHLLGEFLDPDGIDPESGFHHAAQVAWNALARLERLIRDGKAKTTRIIKT